MRHWKIKGLLVSIKRRIVSFFKDRKKFRERIVGLPVYFEDTGEKIGIVENVLLNNLGDEIGYEIKDSTGRILYFPSDAFEKSKRGLIFAPLWYSEGLKLVNDLEAKTKIPDIHDILLHEEDKDVLYENISSRHPEIKEYAEEILNLKESLIKRLNDLEIRTIKLRKELVELSGKRLLKEISRKEFAEKVIESRREMNIMEIGMKRCRELLLRIEKIPFLPKSIAKEEKEIAAIRNMLKNIPINIVILDENARVIGGNEHIKENFGYMLNEMKNREFTEFVVSGDRKKIKEANEEIFSGQEAAEAEFEFIDKYGIHHALYGRFIGMGSSDKRISVFAFHTKEEENEFKKIFSEKVAHLFFNPLSIAQGYLHLLSEEKYGKLSLEQKSQVERIEKSLRRIEKLVEETIKLKT